MNKTDSRRKLLKSIAAGTGAVVAGKSLPESWSRPVVDSVMLPAHAATSIQSYYGPVRRGNG
jgi:anaerobic selenocysteine-containing dehydrogenase